MIYNSPSRNYELLSITNTFFMREVFEIQSIQSVNSFSPVLNITKLAVIISNLYYFYSKSNYLFYNFFFEVLVVKIGSIYLKTFQINCSERTDFVATKTMQTLIFFFQLCSFVFACHFN